MPDITEMDLVWAAGLFEGEGSIYIAYRGHTDSKYVLTMAMTMTDRQCIEEFGRIIGGWLGDHHKRLAEDDNRKASYICILTAQKAMHAIGALYPYFRTDRVKEKASIAVMFQSSKLIGTPARDPEYKKQQEGFYLQLKELNQRGKSSAVQIT